MKIYKCIALVTLILGLALCVGGVLMSGLDQLPDEAQKVTNYVKFKSFGKAKDVNLELGVDVHCNLDLELSALNGKIVYYDGNTIKVEGNHVNKDYDFKYNGQVADISFTGVTHKKETSNLTLYIPRNIQFNHIDLDIDVKKLCFEGPIEELSKTSNTQPCMVTVAVIATKLLKENGIDPDFVAGLSLGEYSALNAAGVLDDQTAISLVRFRGQAMERAVMEMESKMVAIIGLDRELLDEAVAEASDLGVVSIANYNCPGQIVITGDKEAVANAAPALKEAGAKRVIPLNVSGPFHSIYLKEAGEKLYEALSKVTLGELKIPYVTNVDANIIKDTERTKELLKEQVYSSVLWEQSIRAMIADGVDIFVEIGPGKTLSGFMRKIDKSVKMFRIGTMEEVEKTVEAIKEL